MKKKNRHFAILLMVVISVTTFAALHRTVDTMAVEQLQQGISKEIIRFHVRANSDSDEDQTLKLKVKAAVVDYLTPLLEDSSSLDETREILEEQQDNIYALSINTLRENGCDMDVKVYFEHCYFPVKSYGDVTFPPGEYEAFRIDIGESAGKNWWCVLYPPLCFVDTVYGVVPDESKDKLKNVLNEEEYHAVTNTEYKFRFKYLTFLNQFIKE